MRSTRKTAVVSISGIAAMAAGAIILTAHSSQAVTRIGPAGPPASRCRRRQRSGR